jgi:hypothetical protein
MHALDMGFQDARNAAKFYKENKETVANHDSTRHHTTNVSYLPSAVCFLLSISCLLVDIWKTT